MKTIRPGWIVTLLLCSNFAAFAQAAPQQAHTKKASSIAPSFAFEPLDNWKAAVLAGDKAALTSYYTTSPPARTKTPKAETLDPSEEPMFWSSLKPAGLDRLDVKVLEANTLQPGVMSLVLRVEADIKTSAGENSSIISASQVWVQKLGDWKIIATQRGDLVAKQLRRLPEPAKPNIQLYPPPEEAQAEISSALAAAAKDHKRVLLVFGGNWCYDCHVLDATFRSKDFAPIVNANYHVLHINVGNYDANLDLADKYQIPLKKGVPSLAILDPDGKLVVSQKQGEFESTVRIGPEDVLEFLKKWKPQRGS
ncbi:MAG: thioredoxin family protein [Candidatus Acidiferrales bacterium]